MWRHSRRNAGKDSNDGDEVSKMKVAFTINGKLAEVAVEARQLLVHTLRDTLRLTGTHIGCDTSQCGSCTVLVDRKTVRSCTVVTPQAEGWDVRTIEGMDDDELVKGLKASVNEVNG